MLVQNASSPCERMGAWELSKLSMRPVGCVYCLQMRSVPWVVTVGCFARGCGVVDRNAVALCTQTCSCRCRRGLVCDLCKCVVTGLARGSKRQEGLAGRDRNF